MQLPFLRRWLGFRVLLVPAFLLLMSFSFARAQDDGQHGRKYKPLPPTSHITVTVLKAFNNKPLMNAAVVFHAVRDGKNDGNLEVKTDEDGKAVIDVIEIGSHVTVQVIASGFATAAQDIDVNGPQAALLVKMQRPHEQISQFGETDTSQNKPGVQEPVHTPPPPSQQVVPQ